MKTAADAGITWPSSHAPVGRAAHAGILLTAAALSNKLLFVSTPEPHVFCRHPGNDEVHLLDCEEGKISDHVQFLLSSLCLITGLITKQVINFEKELLLPTFHADEDISTLRYTNLPYVYVESSVHCIILFFPMVVHTS